MSKTNTMSKILVAGLFSVAAALVFAALWPELHRHSYVADCVDRETEARPRQDLRQVERQCYLEFLELHGGG